MKIIEVASHAKQEFIDITSLVRKTLRDSGVKDGVGVIFVPHTTAAITINENADPSVRADILMTLKTAAPDTLHYTHAEGNSHAHVKASLIGSSISVLIEGGHLLLGTWQGIYFCEFDGPRKRKIYIKAISG